MKRLVRAWLRQRPFAHQYVVVPRNISLTVKHCIPGFFSLPQLCVLGDSRRGMSSRSRRRYSKEFTRGRSDHVRDHIKVLKSFPTKAQAREHFDTLHPRLKLDIVKRLHTSHKKHHRSSLPKYFSPSFKDSYYFKEEELEETSTLGRGPGGQATNRRKQTVIIKHKPSHIIVKASRFPSLRLNRRAARELLHLRLEEKLLGSKSLLGKAKAAAAQRVLRRAKEREEKKVKDAIRACKEANSTDFFSFLSGHTSLPPYARIQIFPPPACDNPLSCPAISDSSCRISSFLNEDPQNLWKALWNGCRHTNPNIFLLGSSGLSTLPYAKDSTGETAQVSKDSTCMFYSTPALLHFIFPIAATNALPTLTSGALDPGDGMPKEMEKKLLLLRLAREDAVVCQRIRAALNCFSDLFGLHVRPYDTSQKSSEVVVGTTLCEPKSIRVVRDGINWVEKKNRMWSKDAPQCLTHIGVIIWTHIVRSMADMEFSGEKEALEKFFKIPKCGNSTQARSKLLSNPLEPAQQSFSSR